MVYEFNPFTPLDLIPLPNPSDSNHKERVLRFKFVNKMHDRVKLHIQYQIERYIKHNKKRKEGSDF